MFVSLFFYTSDHSGNEVDLDMAPGDMVLYESAKLLHGRPGE